MIVQPFGDAALLVTFSAADLPDDVTPLDAVLALAGLMESADDKPAGIADLVPASCTLTIVCDTTDPGLDKARIHSFVSTLAKQAETGAVEATAVGNLVSIPVTYDGADLGFLAEFFHCSEADLVDWHTARRWRAAFAGFAPGFVYLIPHDYRRTPAVDIDVRQTPTPRLASPRTSIPAGSVALAGEYSAIYPLASPGGWQLLGHTTSTIFDIDRTPPALINPGDLVVFDDVNSPVITGTATGSESKDIES